MIFRPLFRHLIASASLILLAPSSFAAEVASLSEETLRSACVMVKAHITRRGAPPIASATGTGFFVASDLILTCNHCTRIPMPHGMVNANDVQVELDGGRFVRARVIARDAAHDLALLRVDGITASEAGCKPLPISKFGLDSGSPITIVGNFPEAIRVTRGQLLTRRIMPGFAMGNAKVRSGFSGGPVIGADGAVHGILSQRDDANNSIFVRSDVILSLLSRYGRTTPPASDPAPSSRTIADAESRSSDSDKPAAARSSERAAPKKFQPAADTTGDKIRIEPAGRSAEKPSARKASEEAPLVIALPVRKAAPAE